MAWAISHERENNRRVTSYARRRWCEMEENTEFASASGIGSNLAKVKGCQDSPQIEFLRVEAKRLSNGVCGFESHPFIYDVWWSNW